MLMHMRTTINLPDSLAEAAKKRAVQEGRTFTSLVVEGLRSVLDQTKPSATEIEAEPLPSYGKPGGRILVDLEDRDAVWEALTALDADSFR